MIDKRGVIRVGLAALGMAALIDLTAAHASVVTPAPMFQVLLTITKACSVTAGTGSNINLGSVASTVTSTNGSSTISVTCSKTTPYFIGLQPTGASTTGAGFLVSTGILVPANTDKVPYQLYSDAGDSIVWGNTATSTAVGNGVSGAGIGTAQTINVYAATTGGTLNFTPDNYVDTVTVNVNY